MFLRTSCGDMSSCLLCRCSPMITQGDKMTTPPKNGTGASTGGHRRLRVPANRGCAYRSQRLSARTSRRFFTLVFRLARLQQTVQLCRTTSVIHHFDFMLVCYVAPACKLFDNLENRLRVGDWGVPCFYARNITADRHVATIAELLA